MTTVSAFHLLAARLKAKAKAERRPRRPEEPEWRGTKLLSGIVFSMTLFSALAFSSTALKARQLPLREVPIGAAWALLTVRSGRNLYKTFYAASESGERAQREAFSDKPLPPPTLTLNGSRRESYGLLAAQTFVAGTDFLLTGQVPDACLAYGLSAVAGKMRQLLTYPEDGKGNPKPPKDGGPGLS